MENAVVVRIFGSLRPLADALGLPYTTTALVPEHGTPAREIAVSLGLPADKIEGVFVNHTVHGIGVTVHPGDQIAFVPYDTPGPHRFFLGLYSAGRSEEDGSGA